MDNINISVPAMLMGYFNLNLQKYKCKPTCDAIWCFLWLRKNSPENLMGGTRKQSKTT